MGNFSASPPTGETHLGQLLDIRQRLDLRLESAEERHVVSLSQKLLLNTFQNCQRIPEKNLRKIAQFYIGQHFVESFCCNFTFHFIAAKYIKADKGKTRSQLSFHIDYINIIHPYCIGIDHHKASHGFRLI